MKSNQQQPTAWYKQFWPWFLIALPGSVVIASMATIYIALQNPESVVIDDYYKAGLAINRNLSREQMANELDIKSTLQINRDNNRVRVMLDTGTHDSPQQVQLRLMHPTLPGKDQSIILKRVDSMSYTGIIKPLAQGTWNIIIESDSPSWRIQRRTLIDDTLDQYTIR